MLWAEERDTVDEGLVLLESDSVIIIIVRIGVSFKRDIEESDSVEEGFCCFFCLKYLLTSENVSIIS